MFELANNPFALLLYDTSLSSAYNYTIKQYRASENITLLRYLQPNGGITQLMDGSYIIPKDTNITVVWSRGVSSNLQGINGTYEKYDARITILLDSAWILKAGTQGAPGMMTACHGYYTANYSIAKYSATDVQVSNFKGEFCKTADVNIARVATITLDKDKWTGSGPYTQTISSLTNITANSKIDLTPTPIQLNQFYNNGHSFVIENNNKLITAYCIGQKPTTSYTVTVAITEVAV